MLLKYQSILIYFHANIVSLLVIQLYSQYAFAMHLLKISKGLFIRGENARENISHMHRTSCTIHNHVHKQIQRVTFDHVAIVVSIKLLFRCINQQERLRYDARMQ